MWIEFWIWMNPLVIWIVLGGGGLHDMAQAAATAKFSPLGPERLAHIIPNFLLLFTLYTRYKCSFKVLRYYFYFIHDVSISVLKLNP